MISHHEGEPAVNYRRRRRRLGWSVQQPAENQKNTLHSKVPSHSIAEPVVFTLFSKRKESGDCGTVDRTAFPELNPWKDFLRCHITQ